MEKRKLFWSERVQQVCLVLLALLWFWEGEVSMLGHFTCWVDYDYRGLLAKLLYFAVTVFVLASASFLVFAIEKQLYKKFVRYTLLFIPLAYVFMSVMGVARQVFSDMTGDRSAFILVGIPLVALIHLAQAFRDDREVRLLKQKAGETLHASEHVLYLSFSLYVFCLEFLFCVLIWGLFLYLFEGYFLMLLLFIPLIVYCILCLYLLFAWQRLSQKATIYMALSVFGLFNFLSTLILCCFLWTEPFFSCYFGLIALLSLIIFIVGFNAGVKRKNLE